MRRALLVLEIKEDNWPFIMFLVVGIDELLSG